VNSRECKMSVSDTLPPRDYVTTSELLSRARDCLAGKSKSYVLDATHFAKALLLLEPELQSGEIEIEVER